MAGEWETRRIGDLGRVVTGKTPSTAVPQNFGGEYPFITIPDLVGRRDISSSTRTLSELGAQSLRTCRLPAGAVMMPVSPHPHPTQGGIQPTCLT